MPVPGADLLSGRRVPYLPEAHDAGARETRSRGGKDAILHILSPSF
jgi:hypothetical protein